LRFIELNTRNHGCLNFATVEFKNVTRKKLGVNSGTVNMRAFEFLDRVCD
jgi:hypothetical protein